MVPINCQQDLQQVEDPNKKATILIKDQFKNQLQKIMKTDSNNFELSMEVIRPNKIMLVGWKQKCLLDNKAL